MDTSHMLQSLVNAIIEKESIGSICFSRTAIPIIRDNTIHVFTRTRHDTFRVAMDSDVFHRIMVALIDSPINLLEALTKETPSSQIVALKLIEKLSRSGFLCKIDLNDTEGVSHITSKSLTNYLCGVKMMVDGIEPSSIKQSHPTNETSLRLPRVLILGTGDPVIDIRNKLTTLGIVYDSASCIEDINQPLGRVITNYKIVIALGDSFTVDDYRRINNVCIQNMTPWIRYRVVGMTVELGPLVIPFESSCYECYLTRKSEVLRSVSPDTSPDEYHALHRLPPIPSSLSLGLDFLLNEVVRVLADIPANTCGKLCTIDLFSYDIRFHTIIKSPRCICSKQHTRQILSWDKI